MAQCSTRRNEATLGKVIEPPYKPNPMKFRYLLQNNYETLSNLGTITQSNNDDNPLKMAADPGSACSPSPKKRMLGDFTMYKVNKEFENF